VPWLQDTAVQGVGSSVFKAEGHTCNLRIERGAQWRLPVVEQKSGSDSPMPDHEITSPPP